jgi:repressor LexA
MDMSTKKADNKLTHRQAEIVDFIREYLRENGMPPTQSEIAARFGLKSIYGVRQHLKLIEKKGYLRLIRGKARGIRLTSSLSSERDHEICEIPIVGHIAAGQPVLAVEDVQESLKVGEGIFHGRNLFALRVKGDSMINAGIAESDIAIINQQPQVDNGDIAAVILDDEATLKRVMLEQGRVRLKAENDHFQDIVITSETDQQFRILGRFVGLIRQGPIKLYNFNGLS